VQKKLLNSVFKEVRAIELCRVCQTGQRQHGDRLETAAITRFVKNAAHCLFDIKERESDYTRVKFKRMTADDARI